MEIKDIPQKGRGIFSTRSFQKVRQFRNSLNGNTHVGFSVTAYKSYFIVESLLTKRKKSHLIPVTSSRSLYIMDLSDQSLHTEVTSSHCQFIPKSVHTSRLLPVIYFWSLQTSLFHNGSVQTELRLTK